MNNFNWSLSDQNKFIRISLRIGLTTLLFSATIYLLAGLTDWDIFGAILLFALPIVALIAFGCSVVFAILGLIIDLTLTFQKKRKPNDLIISFTGAVFSFLFSIPLLYFGLIWMFFS